jgi:hypothetical protein
MRHDRTQAEVEEMETAEDLLRDDLEAEARMTKPTAEQYHRALDRAILLVVGQNRVNVFNPENQWPEIDEGLKLLAVRPDLPTTLALINLMDARGIRRPTAGEAKP